MNTFKVVSDLICPWCYIGKRRLEAALMQVPRRIPALVSWHPFQLNPDMPPEGLDRQEYCVRKFGSWEKCQEMFQQISEVGKAVGIQFRFDLQLVVPNTFDAHRLIWLAGNEEAQDSMVEALFQAYFCEGINLSKKTNLVEIAESAGLDRPRIERLLYSNEAVAEVMAEEREVKALGVSSVPLFIIQDRIAVSGAQPPETLLKALAKAKAAERKQPAGSH
ncbi:MAG TPA: DsbA family oxidoreductase [Clostridia bacterium]|nr:DsbA family oxidoreductase [Clostridia bacterium]